MSQEASRGVSWGSICPGVTLKSTRDFWISILELSIKESSTQLAN